MDAGTTSHAPTTPPDIPVFTRRIGSWRVSLERRPLSGAEIRRSYDRIAGGWNRTIERLARPAAYRALLRRVMEDAPAHPNGTALRVLDCGVGTGALSLALAGVVQGPLRLDGIDVSPRMLEEAATRFREGGLDVALRQGDVRRLPYRDGAFDMVLAAHVVEHLPDPGAALQEMVRVVRPGGRVLVCLTRRSALGLWIHLKWRTHMAGPAEAAGWLHRAGLRNVRFVFSGARGVARQLAIACIGTRPA